MSTPTGTSGTNDEPRDRDDEVTDPTLTFDPPAEADTDRTDVLPESGSDPEADPGSGPDSDEATRTTVFPTRQTDTGFTAETGTGPVQDADLGTEPVQDHDLATERRAAAVAPVTTAPFTTAPAPAAPVTNAPPAPPVAWGETPAPVVQPGGREVRMRTVVFGLVLLVIAGAVLVGQLTDITVDAGAVLLALMIGGGLLLLAGARRA